MRSSFISASSESENMWSKNWTNAKWATSHMPLSELWDKEAWHMRTSAQDHMLPRFLLKKKLILYDSGGDVRFLNTTTECKPQRRTHGDSSHNTLLVATANFKTENYFPYIYVAWDQSLFLPNSPVFLFQVV